MNIDIKFIVIIILAGIIAFQNCGSKDDKHEKVVINGITYNKIKYSVDTFETVKTKTYHKKGDDLFFEKIVIDTEYLNKPVDTLMILSDYFTKKLYKDTLMLPDSLGIVFLFDTLYKNSIYGRYWKADVIERKISESTYLQLPEKNEYYYGLNMSGNKTQYLNSISTSILYKNKSKNIFLINLGVQNTGTSLQPFVGGGYYWKIGKK